MHLDVYNVTNGRWNYRSEGAIRFSKSFACFMSSVPLTLK